MITCICDEKHIATLSEANVLGRAPMNLNWHSIECRREFSYALNEELCEKIHSYEKEHIES